MERDDLISERAFALLLQHRGIPFLREDRLAEVVEVLGEKRPDFCITAGPQRVLAEVTEFESPGPLDGLASPFGGAIDPMFSVRRLQKKIQHEKPQLEPYGRAGHPTIIVVANPRHYLLPMDVYHLLQLFGEVATTVPFDGKRLVMEEAANVHTRNRVLREDQKTYVSAVGILRGLPLTHPSRPAEPIDPTRLYLRIVHNPFASTPLDPRVFSGPNDLNLVHNFATDSWEDAAGREVELFD